MKKHTSTVSIADELAEPAQDLMEDAKALVSATANVAEQKVVEARNRLSDALERCKGAGLEAWNNIQDKALDGARAADVTIRKNPYQSIGIAFGLGALLGFLLRRRD